MDRGGWLPGNQELVTVEQGAALAGVDRREILRAITRKELGCVRVGRFRDVRVRRRALAQWAAVGIVRGRA